MSLNRTYRRGNQRRQAEIEKERELAEIHKQLAEERRANRIKVHRGLSALIGDPDDAPTTAHGYNYSFSPFMTWWTSAETQDRRNLEATFDAANLSIQAQFEVECDDQIAEWVGTKPNPEYQKFLNGYL